MNERLSLLLEKNEKWAAKVGRKKPGFFAKTASTQGCRYLWFGCSDARVPATQIVGQGPGNVFVHRNIANQVNHEDHSSMVVLKIGVEVQQVSDIIVCGHTQCLGVQSALQGSDDPLLRKWLQPITDLYERNRVELEQRSVEERQNELVRLNITQQVRQIARNAIVQKAWDEGRDLAVHGLLYQVETGLLVDLQVSEFNPKLRD